MSVPDGAAEGKAAAEDATQGGEGANTASEPAGAQAEKSSAEAQGAAASEALNVFKAAVEEVRALKLQEDDEESMKEAKARLAAAMQAAILAGVTQAELVQASKPPAAEEEENEEEDTGLQPGHQVEIFGLESESGKQLNGKVGRVCHFIKDKDRYQIQLGPDHFVSLRQANLRRTSSDEGPRWPASAEPAQADTSEQPLQVGTRVEVSGLESESGSKLNGKVGIIVEHLADKGRFKVQLSAEEIVSVKPANLIRRPSKRAALDGESSSSSSSSSDGKQTKKKARKNKFDEDKPKQKKKGGKNADDALDSLLGNVTEESLLRDKKARAAGAKAAAAAAAQMAAAENAAAEENARTALQPGDRVEVHGLKSESGRKLNGKSGIIKKMLQDKGRWEVELGQAALQSLKAENLKRLATASASQFCGSQETNGGIINNGYSGPTCGYTML